MSKLSTDALLNRRVQKKERIEQLRTLIEKSNEKIDILINEIEELEQKALDNMNGVQDITFED